MKLVVGLGNVGKPYSNTRHNVGFIALDAILKEFGLLLESSGFNGDYVIKNFYENKAIFIKPTTLMNLSGNCVGEITRFYKIKPEDIIVIHDDLDLPPGKFKIRTSGSAGGHNGIKDIIAKLGTDKFVRFKIGIGHPQQTSVIDHVLGKITPQEKEAMQIPIQKAVEFIKYVLYEPTDIAISKINQGSK